MNSDLLASVIVEGIDWEQIIYLNFEDELLIGMTVQDCNDVVTFYCR